jgi:hypothetical protein
VLQKGGVKLPLPMVHLAVAVRVKEDPSPSFLLGSLSPDAIHMRENSSRDDKRKTHFTMYRSESNPMDVFKSILTTHQNHSDFSKGYCVHLLTDVIWLDTVYNPFMEQLPEDMPKQEATKLYYLDTDQIDFNLYNRVSWRPIVWNLLAQSKPADFNSLLTAEEIIKWRDRVLNWYGGLMQEPKITPVYITDLIVNSFIEKAVEDIQNQFNDWNIAL